MPESMIERLKVALTPFLHHGLDAYPDVGTEAAKAVIGAMRQPTDAMITAGTRTGDDANTWIKHQHFERGWTAAIDAALDRDA